MENVFEMFDLLRDENAHSDMLAYLFRPADNWSIGDTFLQAFLEKIAAVRGTQKAMNGEMISSILKDMKKARGFVWRETTHTGEKEDIDIAIRFPGINAALIIENKIDSEVHDSNQNGKRVSQLEKYVAEAHGWDPNIRLIPILLRVHGETGKITNEGWIELNYRDILSCLRRTKEILANSGKAPSPMLEEYIQVVERNLLCFNADMNEVENLLCRRLGSDYVFNPSTGINIAFTTPVFRKFGEVSYSWRGIDDAIYFDFRKDDSSLRLFILGKDEESKVNTWNGYLPTTRGFHVWKEKGYYLVYYRNIGGLDYLDDFLQHELKEIEKTMQEIHDSDRVLSSVKPAQGSFHE
jgi:hypothetical protein